MEAVEYNNDGKTTKKLDASYHIAWNEPGGAALSLSISDYPRKNTHFQVSIPLKDLKRKLRSKWVITSGL